jgi:hypothetical protein
MIEPQASFYILLQLQHLFLPSHSVTKPTPLHNHKDPHLVIVPFDVHALEKRRTHNPSAPALATKFEGTIIAKPFPPKSKKGPRPSPSKNDVHATLFPPDPMLLLAPAQRQLPFGPKRQG